MSPRPASLMTILMITGTWPPLRCGVGDYSSRLCEELQASSLQIHVITSRQARPDFKLEGQSLLEVRPVVRKWDWSALSVIRRLAEEIDPDIVLFQWPTAAYGRSLAVNLLPLYIKRWLPRCRLITTLHEFRYFQPWTRWRLLPAARDSDRLIAVDPQDLAGLQKMFPRAAARSLNIPIGSNLPSVGPDFNRPESRRSLGLGSQDFVVAFFGFANPPKGLEYLLDALGKLRQTHPDIKLLLLSQLSDRTAYQRKILRQITAAGLDEITVRPEYAETREAAGFLASADCAALPFRDGASWKRGTLLACLAQGLPVLTTQSPAGPVEPFRNEENLLLVPPTDSRALAAGLERLRAEPELRGRLRAGARSLSDFFSWEEIGRRHVRLFSEVTEDARL